MYQIPLGGVETLSDPGGRHLVVDGGHGVTQEYYAASGQGGMICDDMTILSGKHRELLWALSLRIVWATRELSAAERGQFLDSIESQLQDRPRTIQRQFKLLLAVVRYSTLPRRFARLDKLPAEQQDAALRRFQNSRFTLLRKGFWGLKTMLHLGYYGLPGTATRVHYAPSIQGNERLHAP